MFDNLKFDWKVFLGFYPKQQYLTYLTLIKKLELSF